MGVEGDGKKVWVFLQDVHVMVVVFVLLLVLVVEHDIPLGLFDIRLEHLIWRVRQFAPLVNLLLEQVVPDVRVSV